MEGSGSLSLLSLGLQQLPLCHVCICGVQALQRRKPRPQLSPLPSSDGRTKAPLPTLLSHHISVTSHQWRQVILSLGEFCPQGTFVILEAICYWY